MNIIQDYAIEGLRTLCLAFRDIPEQEYRQWAVIYDQATATVNGRVEALDQAAEIIEKDLFLLGATAIEDKLQEGVPDTIHTLQMAGIKVFGFSFIFPADSFNIHYRYGFLLVIDKRQPSISGCPVD